MGNSIFWSKREESLATIFSRQAAPGLTGNFKISKNQSRN